MSNYESTQWTPLYWVPTHIIRTALEAFEVCLVDGAAYTAEEWEETLPADWECSDNGEWTFLGEPFPGAVVVEECENLSETDPGDETPD